MARRAQSGLKPLHLIALLAFLAAVLGVGYKVLSRGGDSFTGVTPLSAEEFLDNAAALSGNEYRVEGTIADRLDNWKASEGRLFSVQVTEGGTFLPVWVPSHVQANIQRGQRYLFKVRVLETGILEVIELLKA
ncbi:MAG TPA: hypothetical protein VD994_09615 [Prosthecobacter sp.]|nr:hypothetical protein [Prosthecobacter sp.]